MSRGSPRPDYYGILGTSHDSEREQIDSAFRTLMLKYRDDVSQQERARQIRLAYKVLSDPQRKARYDGAEQVLDAAAPAEGGVGGDAGARPQHWRRAALALLVPIVGAAAFLAFRNPDFENQPPVGKPEQPAIASAALPSGAGKVNMVSQTGETAVTPNSVSHQHGAVENSESIENGTPLSSEGAVLAAGRQPVKQPRRPELAVPEMAAQASSRDDGREMSEEGAGAGTEPLGLQNSPAPAPLTGSDNAEPTARPQSTQGTKARWLSGGLVDADNASGRFEGVVSVGLTVLPDGRAVNCRVTRSSGDPSLDSTTCRLLERRLRFEPARDAAGQAQASEVTATHAWIRRKR